ncbi:MAG: lipid A biosynthesis acyltransferase [Alphaproteobacteria bacterium]|nr:lipid A biosynthesis acyltransferase [Alphaproteobacteria bacterium]
MKKIRYAVEAALLYSLFFIFRIIGPEKASAAGGWIGRTIGPHLAASRKAHRNIEKAFPGISEQRKDEIIRGMWDNLGRVIAEYPHLEKLSRDYTHIEGIENIQELLKSDQAAVFISAHFGNWEINCPALFTQLNKEIDLTYREPNNPWTAKLLNEARSLGGRLKGFRKGAESGRHILTSLREKRYLGILIDQKYNEGLSVPFFGHPSMTNPIFVQLAQRYKCPLVPAKVERIQGCKFKGTIVPPLKTHDEQGNPLPVEEVIISAHAILESWIRERPEQWLWLHRRWPESK